MEAAEVHMETQASARSNWPRCSSSRSSNSSQSPMQGIAGLQPEDDITLGRSMSLVGEKHTLRSQVLFPKDYILRKVFRNDGPSLGGDFDPLPERAHVHVRGLSLVALKVTEKVIYHHRHIFLSMCPSRLNHAKDLIKLNQPQSSINNSGNCLIFCLVSVALLMFSFGHAFPHSCVHLKIILILLTS